MREKCGGTEPSPAGATLAKSETFYIIAEGKNLSNFICKLAKKVKIR
jgi:hypothetical protein